jgi:Response regulator containing a CheY-like receiver domain and an HD-GYP domain
MSHYIDVIHGPTYSGRKKPAKDSIDRWTGLSNLSRYLLESNSLHDLMERTSRSVVEILGIDFSKIFTLGDNGHYYCQGVYSKTPGLIVSQIDTPVALAAEQIFKQIALSEPPLIPYYLTEGYSPEECLIISGQAGADLWLVPLSANSQKIGFLLLGKKCSTNESHYLIESTHLVDLLAGQLSNAILRVKLNARLSDSTLEIVQALTNALDARDTNSKTHSEHLAKLSAKLAAYLGCSEKETLDIYWAAMLHDIGKIGVADQILHKPGPLTVEEWKLMRKHPQIGARIVQGMTGLDGIAPLILMHHERMDGSGYPSGLSGNQIPLGARIIAVVDSYSAITEGRDYREKRTHAEALEELRRCKGILFDEHIVDAFLRMIDIP